MIYYEARIRDLEKRLEEIESALKQLKSTIDAQVSLDQTIADKLAEIYR